MVTQDDVGKTVYFASIWNLDPPSKGTLVALTTVDRRSDDIRHRVEAFVNFDKYTLTCQADFLYTSEADARRHIARAYMKKIVAAELEVTTMRMELAKFEKGI